MDTRFLYMWSLDLQTELSPYKVIVLCCKCRGFFFYSSAKVGFVSSEILSDNEDLFKILLKYLKDVETNGKEWKMCYNAKEHSYSAASFHDHCNNKGPTVTLARVGQFVFGGYTDQAWTSSKCHDTTRSVAATRAIPKLFLATDD